MSVYKKVASTKMSTKLDYAVREVPLGAIKGSPLDLTT